MSQAELQEKVTSLEREVNDLKAQLKEAKGPPNPKAWRQSIGMFKDDPEFDAIIQKGREYRESQPYPEDVEDVA